jgi:hypothetical protein
LQRRERENGKRSKTLDEFKSSSLFGKCHSVVLIQRIQTKEAKDQQET